MVAGYSIPRPTTALLLSAIEFRDSVKHFLPSILAELPQIMTNASMVVHIINSHRITKLYIRIIARYNLNHIVLSVTTN